jgi:hypothetical protein
MSPVRIDSCSFGVLVIDGIRHSEDLLIDPNGRILKPWRRRKGHKLSMMDLRDLLNAGPEVLVMGTGMNGRVIPDKDLGKNLSKRGVELITAPNQEAIKIFNELAQEKRLGAGFHLTC